MHACNSFGSLIATVLDEGIPHRSPEPLRPGLLPFPGVTMWRWLLDRIIPATAVNLG